MPNLHPYQEKCRDLIVSNSGYGLFMDCGTGKTLTVLSALDKMRHHESIPWTWHTLVIAPKTIARATWIDEIEKWGFDMPYQSLFLNKNGKELSKAKRLKLYEEVLKMPPTVFFINRELVPDLVSFFKKDWPFNFVIIDESQSFKNPQSMRFKALKTVRPYISKIVELSGTPAPKDLLDLWPQIWLLDQGTRLGKTRKAYIENYFNDKLSYNGNYHIYTILPDAEPKIFEKITDITSSVKNTAITLPPISYNTLYAHLTSEETKLYEKFKQDMVLSLEDEAITAQTKAALAAKLWQLASGTLYTDKEPGFIELHQHKLDIMEHIINTTSDNTLILYYFKIDLKRITERLAKMGLKPYGEQSDGDKFAVFDGSIEMMRAWNRGEIKTLVLQPASAGHGINIQEGGHTAIWFTLPTSLELYIQANARLYRQGQKYPVIIHKILTKDTFDERVNSLLDQKGLNQEQLLEAVRLELNL